VSDFAQLEKTLGVTFNKPSLLEQALVHSSYINEKAGSTSASNERLEFLGDAVLGFVIAEKLYQDSPDLNEGEMTQAPRIAGTPGNFSPCGSNYQTWRFPLSRKGNQEAISAGKKLKNMRFDTIYISHLLRAIQTLHYILLELQDKRIPIIYHEEKRIHEWEHYNGDRNNEIPIYQSVDWQNDTMVIFRG
jgi:hypothetical protein